MSILTEEMDSISRARPPRFCATALANTRLFPIRWRHRASADSSASAGESMYFEASLL
jgi:hypothetical protein